MFKSSLETKLSLQISLSQNCSTFLKRKPTYATRQARLIKTHWHKWDYEFIKVNRSQFYYLYHVLKLMCVANRIFMQPSTFALGPRHDNHDAQVLSAWIDWIIGAFLCKAQFRPVTFYATRQNCWLSLVSAREVDG